MRHVFYNVKYNMFFKISRHRRFHIDHLLFSFISVSTPVRPETPVLPWIGGRQCTLMVLHRPVSCRRKDILPSDSRHKERIS